MRLINLMITILAALFPWVLTAQWAFTHTQTRSVRNDAGRTSPSGTIALTGDSEDIRQLVTANDTTQVFLCNWSASGLKSFYLHCTVAATVTIKDDSDVTVGTITLAANTPFEWATGDPGSAPISGDAATFNISTAAVGTFTLFVLQNSGISASAALTGTFLTTPTEAEVVTGGQTIIITLTNATFVAGGAAFNGQRQVIIDGLTADTSQTNGWNAEVKAALAVTDVARTSSTIVTITLPAVGAYSIASNEVVTVTVPAAATSVSNPIIATPDITIVAA